MRIKQLYTETVPFIVSNWSFVSTTCAPDKILGSQTLIKRASKALAHGLPLLLSHLHEHEAKELLAMPLSHAPSAPAPRAVGAGRNVEGLLETAPESLRDTWNL